MNLQRFIVKYVKNLNKRNYIVLYTILFTISWATILCIKHSIILKKNGKVREGYVVEGVKWRSPAVNVCT